MKKKAKTCVLPNDPSRCLSIHGTKNPGEYVLRWFFSVQSGQENVHGCD